MSSDAPSSPRRPRRPRRRLLRIGLYALLALGVAAAIGLGYRAYFLSKAVRQVAEATAELDRTDPGWRWEDILAGSKPLPSEANSAPLVVAAASRLPEDWPDRRAAAPGRADGAAGDLARSADWRVLSVMVLPTLANAAVAHHELCNQLDAAILALAAERFHLEGGRWPESLEDLVPAYAAEVPRDRFGPGNLRLGRREDGIVIYSVGQDQKDDGGAIERHNEGLEEVKEPLGGRDLGFRLWDPDKRRQ